MYKNLFNEIFDYSPSNSQIYTDAFKTNSCVAIAIINNDLYFTIRL